jgi:hypothetical protein
MCEERPGGKPAAVAPSSEGAVRPSATSGAAPVALGGTVTDKGQVDDTGKGANFAPDFEAGDNYFAPTFVKASPGATVKVTVKNTGASPHPSQLTERPSISSSIHQVSRAPAWSRCRPAGP